MLGGGKTSASLSLSDSRLNPLILRSSSGVWTIKSGDESLDSVEWLRDGEREAPFLREEEELVLVLFTFFLLLCEVEDDVDALAGLVVPPFIIAI